MKIFGRKDTPVPKERSAPILYKRTQRYMVFINDMIEDTRSLTRGYYVNDVITHEVESTVRDFDMWPNASDDVSFQKKQQDYLKHITTNGLMIVDTYYPGHRVLKIKKIGDSHLEEITSSGLTSR